MQGESGFMKLRHRQKGGSKAPLGSGQRFASLENKLSHQKGVTNPRTLAGSIGDKKYGASKMASLSAKGRMR